MDSLQQTAEFMRAAGQNIPAVPTVPTVEVRKLRLALMLEELHELAEAFGLVDTFDKMMVQKSGVDAEGFAFYHIDTLDYSDVAALDALCDSRVVADGAILACGMQDIFPAALAEVHRSNMSKFPKDMLEVVETVQHYEQQGISCYGVSGSRRVVLRNPDNKVLKSVRYSPANLAPLLQRINASH